MSIARHILVATDFSEFDEAAIGMAGELAQRLAAKLTVLHVHGHPPEPPEAVVPPERLVWSSDLDTDALQALQELKIAKLADVESIDLVTVEDGMPAHAIYKYASNHGMDLIVLGSHERTGLAHFFFASVPEKVVKHAPCAVLVVPPSKRQKSKHEESQKVAVPQAVH